MARVRDSVVGQSEGQSRRRWVGLLAWLGTPLAAVALWLACTADVSPFFISGPEITPNFSPSLEITSPVNNISVAKGARFLITWTDSDADSAAQVSFDMIDTQTGTVFPIVGSISENDEGDTWSASTDALVEGTTYNLRGRITDFITTVDTFAELDQPGGGRVVVTIAGEGAAPANQPPQIHVFEPQFNQGVSQDDLLVVAIQPIEFEPNQADPDLGDPGDVPYDPDSEIQVLVLLDLDDDPTNDDPFNPQPDELILLRTAVIPALDSGIRTFDILIDVATIPIRSDGSPYFVRVTVSDSVNPPVSVYADGTISVVRAASGTTLDLGDVGKTVSGAQFTGFNPGANLGSTMTGIGDFDDDGIDDFILVAQFGNPRNYGLVGEAYLIYGQDSTRFGSSINVNSTSTSIPGVIFEGGPARLADTDSFSNLFGTPLANARTDGITSVASIGDLDGDGRPELLMGLPHTDGIYQGRDDDPGDDPVGGDETDAVVLDIRQGQTTTTVGDGAPAFTSFSGTQDSYIDSAAPASNFGSDTELQWLDNGPGDSRWTLIKFTDILNEIPDTAATIEGLSAQLQIRVNNEGDGAMIHELFTDFDESNVTFNNLAVNGGAPEAGVDYDDDELGTLGGDTAGDFDTVDISPLLQKLIDGQLDDIDNEIRLILVADADDNNDTRLRSSEFGDVADHRPTLLITYERSIPGGGLACYPDNLVNNFATEGNLIRDDDSIEALGYVTLINSSNRDNAGGNLINLNRLDSTSVSLELVGQEVEYAFIGFDTIQLAQGAEPGRIAGCRIQAGWYDFIDHRLLRQPPLNGRFGWTVASIADMDNDQLPEILISSPTNELEVEMTEENFFFSTHLESRAFFGSITVIPGNNYDLTPWRDKAEAFAGNAILPVNAVRDIFKQIGDCGTPTSRLGPFAGPPNLFFEIFAESTTDFMGGAQSAGDFNLDGVPDILCGAPGNDRSGNTDAGAVYILYGRTPTGDYDLRNGAADNALTRPPMLRIFGETTNDQLGGELIRGDVRTPRRAGFIRQTAGLDINGDRIDDVIFAAPRADFGDVNRPDCAPDFDGNGIIDDNDLDLGLFEACVDSVGSEVFLDDDCKVFDFDNDRELTSDETRSYDEDGLILNDRNVLECLILGDSDCCPIDNGFVGIIFGGTTTDGDRSLSQLATSDLPGTVFYGAEPGHRIGMDIASAGDFNKDGTGDLLIVAPGVTILDENLQTRVGVVYLIFGGNHLENRTFVLSPTEVGSNDLPGIVFMSPYVEGRPNEAPPDHVGQLGDINNDGFDDIAIGITRADSVDESLPQDDGGAVDEPSAGRRPDAGDVYIIYGNNVGSNTLP